MPTRSRSLPAGLCLVALIAAGCAQDGATDGADPSTASGTEVAVVDNAFEPTRLETEAGETVTWSWQGDNPHDVVFDDVGSEIQTEGTFTHTFDEPGEYAYTCTVHGNMDGTVVVVEP